MFTNAINLLTAGTSDAGAGLAVTVTIFIYVLWFLLIFLLLGVSAVSYIINAIAIFKLAKKHNLECPALAFVPVFNIYLLNRIPGNKPFTLFGGSLKFEDRNYAFALSAACSFLVGVLGIVATVANAFINYGILKAVFDEYSHDEAENNKKAIIATVLDYVLTMGIVRGVLLLKLTKEENKEETPAIEEKVAE